MFDHSQPPTGLGRFGDEFQVFDVLANRAAELMSEYEAGKRLTVCLALLGHRLEADVLCEQQSREFVSANAQRLIWSVHILCFEKPSGGRDVSRGQIAVFGIVKVGRCQVSRFSCGKKCNVFLLVFSRGANRCGDGSYGVNSCFGLKGRSSHRSVQ